jgi:hypothetical protein
MFNNYMKKFRVTDSFQLFKRLEQLLIETKVEEVRGMK